MGFCSQHCIVDLLKLHDLITYKMQSFFAVPTSTVNSKVLRHKKSVFFGLVSLPLNHLHPMSEVGVARKIISGCQRPSSSCSLKITHYSTIALLQNYKALKPSFIPSFHFSNSKCQCLSGYNDISFLEMAASTDELQLCSFYQISFIVSSQQAQKFTIKYKGLGYQIA